MYYQKICFIGLRCISVTVHVYEFCELSDLSDKNRKERRRRAMTHPTINLTRRGVADLIRPY